MDYIIPIIVILLVVVIAILMVRRAIIFENQRGLLYTQGKFTAIWEPGVHWYFTPVHSYRKVEMRATYVTIPGQEVLTADNIGLKVSLAASYQVVDPYLAINQVFNYQEALYLMLQLGLRDAIGALDVDTLMAKRAEIGQALLNQAAEKAAEIGIRLNLVGIKDMMFPGELKTIFAQVVNARKEGLAALERARGESAALRNLANAARLLDDNPNLRQLRLFQTMEKNSGSTVVVLSPDAATITPQIKGKQENTV